MIQIDDKLWDSTWKLGQSHYPLVHCAINFDLSVKHCRWNSPKSERSASFPTDRSIISYCVKLLYILRILTVYKGLNDIAQISLETYMAAAALQFAVVEKENTRGLYRTPVPHPVKCKSKTYPSAGGPNELSEEWENEVLQRQMDQYWITVVIKYWLLMCIRIQTCKTFINVHGNLRNKEAANSLQDERYPIQSLDM